MRARKFPKKGVNARRLATNRIVLTANLVFYAINIATKNVGEAKPTVELLADVDK